MNGLEVSVVIPTYNRFNDLSSCLASILGQEGLPKEIIIVDDSDNDSIRKLVESKSPEFKYKNINLIFIKNLRERSSAIAKNIGIERATGDIVLFLDDDVILDKDYIKSILWLYRDNMSCLGAQGYSGEIKFNKIKNYLSRILCIDFLEKNGCRMLPSLCITFPYILEKTVQCQWLFGCNQSYRRSILNEFKFDENLKRYAHKEDHDLSYRVFKAFPGSLYITPGAKFLHKHSTTARMSMREYIYKRNVHELYLFYKLIDQTTFNKAKYILGRFGLLIQAISDIILNLEYSRKENMLKIYYIILSYILCIRYLNVIKSGHLDFLNEILSAFDVFH